MKHFSQQADEFVYFLFPILCQRINGDNFPVDLAGYGLGIAFVELTLDQNQTDIFLYSQINDFLQMFGTWFFAVLFNGYLF